MIKLENRGNVHSIAYSRDGAYLLALYSGRRLRLWSLADYRPRLKYRGVGWPRQRRLQIHGDVAVLTHGAYSLANLWLALKQDSATSHPTLHLDLIELQGVSLPTLTLSRDGSLIVGIRAHSEANVYLWGTDGKLVHRYPIPTRTVYPPVLGPNNRQVVVLKGYQAWLCDLTKGRDPVHFRHTDDVHLATFSPDGKWLATAAGRSVWLWDIESGEGQRQLAFEKHVHGLAFHPQSRLLAAGDREGIIRLWEMPGMKQIASLNFEIGGIHDIAFAPDGMTVAAAGHENAIAIWDME